MQRISATDAMFLDIESPNSPMIIGALVILDPATAPGSFVRHRDILAYVNERLHLAPNLRRKLVYHPLGLDEPRLIDDPDFDLEFHVRHIGLPRPRDLRQLKILSSRLISRPMDLHRPLWEMYIIEGLEDVEGAPADAFAMLFKMHHATFDGKAGGAALWAFMQDTPEFAPDQGSQSWSPGRAPDAIGWTFSSIEEGLKQWIANSEAVPKLARGAWEASVKNSGAPQKGAGGTAVPQTRFQQKLTSHRVFDWVRWDMLRVQALRVALGKPKMNDFLVAVVGGALRRYLAHHNELPDSPLLALCPVNVRGTGDPLAGGNHVSMMRADLGSDTADPLARLAAVAASTKRGKEQIEALGPEFVGDLLGLLPYAVRSNAMKAITSLSDRTETTTQPLANTIITNAPPPPGGHYFTGAEVLTYAGFGPVREGMGIFHTIAGMDFEVTISVTSCRELLPDPSFYVECLMASFEDYEAAAKTRPTRPAGQGGRPRPKSGPLH